jgi:RNA polymerase sigma-70 factor (ECF subfamily)
VDNGDALLDEIPRLRRYARALVGDRNAADDLVQDTLERAWHRRAQWRPGSSARPWLFGIMHNLRIDQLRRAAIPTLPMDDDDDLPVRPTQSDALEVRDLESALGQLGEEQRTVLLLVAIEEMSYADVAEVLGIPQGTVMSRLARAREKLRAIMEGRQASAPLRIVK